ncbi:N-6 DNA methylase [Candidatus Woesearchaeota archaeon]|nr:N-6 DNA methylase [Candidatus Woesearchaeota archaeon]
MIEPQKLKDSLKKFGAQDIILFSEEHSVNNINYLDIVNMSEDHLKPDAVIEFQNEPLMYIINFNNFTYAGTDFEDELIRIKNRLACRGDAPYFGILKPGELQVFSIGLSKDRKLVLFKKDSEEDAILTIPRIGLGEIAVTEEDEKIHDLLYRLLEQSIEEIHRLKFDLYDALSLSARGIFVRFLIDRGFISKEEQKSIFPNEDITYCMSNKENLLKITEWLNLTFNGDLLPISEKAITRIKSLEDSKPLFKILTAIVKKYEPVGVGAYQTRLSWTDIDFAHVPIGLLSEVYEGYCHKYDPTAKKNSIHYTPKRIAEYIVEESINSFSDPCNIRILDPAVGAGIFLVIAFRKLVEKNWIRNGKRPDRKMIRKILSTQITGFDINESALRLAALSLYLTALELDPNPRDIKEIKFDQLREKSLFDMHSPNDIEGKPIMGSLSADKKFHGHEYDLVIGNPPWTTINDQISKKFTSLVRDIAKEQGLEQIAKSYENPDNVPDLPFVWKSMEWCKPDGRIAFVLHARLLFKNSKKGRKAREALFTSFKVTGILNGSCLRNTNVWPGITAPFCIIFALNQKPRKDSKFVYLSPRQDTEINSKGIIRLDYNMADPISLDKALSSSHILKTLSRGVSLDVSIIDKIEKASNTNLLRYWKDHKLNQGQGYQVHVKGDKNPTTFLQSLPNLTNRDELSFIIDTKSLPKFMMGDIHRPRKVGIYKSPLLIIPATPPIQASVCFSDLAYTASFTGFSCHGHENPTILAKYLAALFTSNLFLYYALLTSSKFGVERDTMLKEDIENFPVISVEKLTDQQRKKLEYLFDNYRMKNFQQMIDLFVFEVYGLEKHEIQTISDTLSISLPYRKIIKNAERPPTKEELNLFTRQLRQNLSPFLPKGYTIDTLTLKNSPWNLVILSESSDNSNVNNEIAKILENLTKLINKMGTTRVVFNQKKYCVVACQNQYRYFTSTRARLLALEIMSRKIEVLLE